jgi:hypothetical protein
MRLTHILRDYADPTNFITYTKGVSILFRNVTFVPKNRETWLNITTDIDIY